MHQLFIRAFCLLLCTPFILSNAHGMEKDDTADLKLQYTLKQPLPEEKLWTDSQGIEIKEETCKQFDETTYYNCFHIDLPKESNAYVRSVDFATGFSSDRKYYVGLKYCYPNDRLMTEDIAENLKSMGFTTVNSYVYYQRLHQGLFVKTDSTYEVGRFFHFFASLQLIPPLLITNLLEKAKMSIRIYDFDLSVSLLHSRIKKKCEEAAEKECGQPPSKEMSKFETRKKTAAKNNFTKVAMEELAKIPTIRQRATMAWGLRKEVSYESYEDCLRLYSLLNDTWMPYDREAKREQANHTFGMTKQQRNEDQLFPLIRTYLWLDESRDHTRVAEVACAYLDIKSLEEQEKSSSPKEIIIALLSKLRNEITWCKDAKAREEAESLSDVIKSIDNKEREKKLQEFLQQNLSYKTKIKLFEKLRQSKMAFSKEIEIIRIKSQFEDDIIEETPAAYLTAISSGLSLYTHDALSDANEYVKSYLETNDADKELAINFSDRTDTILKLLKRIRKTREERTEYENKWWQRQCRSARDNGY